MVLYRYCCMFCSPLSVWSTSTPCSGWLLLPLRLTKSFWSASWPCPRFEFTNYVKAWQESRIGVYFFNSLYVAILSIVVILFLAVMVSYALARYSFKLRNTIYAFS